MEGRGIPVGALAVGIARCGLRDCDQLNRPKAQLFPAERRAVQQRFPGSPPRTHPCAYRPRSHDPLTRTHFFSLPLPVWDLPSVIPFVIPPSTASSELLAHRLNGADLFVPPPRYSYLLIQRGSHPLDSSNTSTWEAPKLGLLATIALVA